MALVMLRFVFSKCSESVGVDAESFRCELVVNFARQRGVVGARDDDGGALEMTLEQTFEDLRELCRTLCDV